LAEAAAAAAAVASKQHDCGDVQKHRMEVGAQCVQWSGVDWCTLSLGVKASSRNRVMQL
jgi:hypothetical protein